MELRELALQYRQSGKLCAERSAQLRRELEQLPPTGSEAYALRGRIVILESMARDAYATSVYLENYYRRPKADAKKGNDKKEERIYLREGDGVPQLEELRKAIREAGRRSGKGRRASA